MLTDRYLQSEFEGLCDGRRLKGKKGLASKSETKAFELAELCPPDLVFKMIVSPEIATKRKPEINLYTNETLNERVKKIHFSDSTQSFLVDTDQEQNSVILEVKQKIWASLP
ncbi:hypothetical protein FACS1894184_21250 [Clostridia bacterium]|nr:hypothetical protein FACS1894184_21250 [Clostridia bacterium]